MTLFLFLANNTNNYLSRFTGSLVITENEPLLRAITPSSSDCFMEMLMSVNGSGIVTLTQLDEIEETDHLLREKILLFLKVSFYSF
ncbi:hypothetical protein CDAR_51951 [Caerostris darwini]|uniref:Uncharacterized protein n=1 Tax=Caerostris darwini TaxID=1538125 RepID=A0AAV4X7C2_9ARAC|nr:hypothetical protein CDAR_51951 [Caerostris darwini]